MPEPLHYVPYFQDRGYEAFLAALKTRYPVGFFIWLLLASLLTVSYVALKKRNKGYVYPPGYRRGPQRHVWLISLCLFMLSLGLNLWNIGQESLSSMEGTYLSEVATNKSLYDAILNKYGIINSHLPLYRIVVYAALALGHSIEYIRAVSALFGALCPPLLYLFVRRLLPGPTSVCCALLMSVSPIHVYFSQSIMPYSLLTCLVLFHYYSYLLFREHPCRRHMYVYIASVVLGLNAHPIFIGIMLCPLLDQVIMCLRATQGDPRNKRLFYLYLEKTLLGALFFLPALLVEISYLTFYAQDFKSYMAYIDVLPPMSELSQRSAWFLVHIVNLLLSLPKGTLGAGGAVYGGMLFIVASVVLLVLRGPKTFLLVSGPVYVLLLEQFVVFAYLRHPFFEVRYFSSAPAFFWTTTVGAAGLIGQRIFVERHAAGWIRKACGLALLVIATVTGAVLSLSRVNAMYRELDNPDVKSATGFLRQHIRTGDALCITPASFFGDVVLYHLHEPWDDFMTWESRMNALGVHRLPSGQGYVEYFGYITNRFLPWEEASQNLFFERVWLIDIREETLGYPEYTDRAFRRVKRYYDTALEFNGSWQFDGVTLYLYKTRYSIPGFESDEFVLTFGKDDYPYVKGFSPPATQIAPGRIMTVGSGVRIPITRKWQDGEVLRISLIFKPDPSRCVSRAFSLTLRVDGREVTRNYLCTEEPVQQISDLVDWKGHGQGMLEISFHPVGSAAGGEACLPEVRLVELRIDAVTQGR